MPIEMVRANEWIYLRGVFVPLNLHDPLPPLGPKDSIRVVTDNQRLRHFVGFYSPAPSTAVMRVFGEYPEGGEAPDLGYIQLMRLKVGDKAISPALLPGLKDRAPYWHQPSGLFVEFMGPADAKLRLPKSTPPFYALNDTLRRQYGPSPSIHAYYWHPMPNGSLCWKGIGERPAQPRVPWPIRQALVPSVVQQISPFVLDEADLAAYCPQNEPFYEQPKGPESQDPLYQQMLGAYKNAIEEEPPRDALDVQAVGRYLIVGFSAENNRFSDTVLVGAESENKLRIWTISEDTLANLRYRAAARVLERISPTAPRARQTERRRGSGGLHQAPGALSLALEIHAVLYRWLPKLERRDADLFRPSGVRVELKWTYDPVTETIDTPQLVHVGVETEFESIAAAIQQARACIADTPPGMRVDESVFLVAGSPWFDPVPPYQS